MGWATKPLGAICEFSNGLWTGKKPPFEPAIVVRNTNFRPHGRLDHSDVALLDVEAKQLAKRRLQLGDIIIEKSGGGPKQPVGRVAYFDKNDGVYSFSNFTSAARVKDKSEVDPEYLMRFLDWCYISGVTEGIQSHSTGIRNLDLSAYKAIEVPLPPLEEQRRIVAVLDEAFAAIATATANTEKNLANARDLFTIALNTALDGGAPFRPMKEICSFENGDRGENYAGRSAFVPEGLPIINAGHLDDGAIDTKSMNFISRERYDLLRSGKTVRGDILFCLRGSLGKFAYNDLYDEGAIASSLIIIRPHAEILPSYLCHYLRSDLCYQSIKHHENGAAQPNLGGKSLEKFMVPVPSLDEQREIVVRLDRSRLATQELDEAYRRKLSALDRLKQSILHRAFTGEMTATAPDLVPA